MCIYVRWLIQSNGTYKAENVRLAKVSPYAPEIQNLKLLILAKLLLKAPFKRMESIYNSSKKDFFFIKTQKFSSNNGEKETQCLFE